MHTTTPGRRTRLAIGLSLALLGLGIAQTLSAQTLRAPGMREAGSISYDAEGYPTIVAKNDFDAAFLMGYAQARDRIFQMDFLRRAASGTLTELVGDNAIGQDVQIRTIGLRRGAFESWVAADPELKGQLQAFANGVNYWLANNPLPPEYGALELTRAQPWSPLDTLAIGKLLAFQLSFDLDIDFTLRLAAYQQAGGTSFNGAALFFEDTHRIQPGDDRVTVPNFIPSIGGRVLDDALAKSVHAPKWSAETLALAQSYREQIKNHPVIGKTLNFREDRGASNWWIVAGSQTANGRPILANDPHLGLELPPIFYEGQIVSNDSRFARPMEVSGVIIPGSPWPIIGCTPRFCWGFTTNPMDVTDVYSETVRLNDYGLPTHTVYGSRLEPVNWTVQSYFSNRLGDGVADNTARNTSIGYTNGGVTITVPRRNNGPVLQFSGTTALAVAYTGFSGSQEVDFLRRMARAQGLDDVRAAVPYFDVGSQNLAYADIEGNIAYFAMAEAPIREDLQAGAVDGAPPFLIRDAQRNTNWAPVTNRQPQQALPYAVLPLNEMPQVVNPASGYIANCNNDPVGVTLDNNALNQLRPGGGIYYLDYAYSSFRQGRIDRLLQAEIAAGRKITPEFMRAAQADTVMLDAQLTLPFLLTAFDNAGQSGAWAELRTLATDPQVAAAIQRLRGWNFTAPTGIREGWDPGDNPMGLAEPSAAEVQASIGATLYSVWRSRAVANVVDATLTRVGLGSQLPGSEESSRTLLHHLRRFPTQQGIGASGVDFFAVTGAPNRAAARDFVLLKSLKDALDALASPAYAAAFNGSRNLDDYRWGRLHRITFRHPLGGPFNIPGANPYPFRDLSAQLPGLPRSGGYNTLDVANHGIRANGANAFTFGSGPARRFIGVMSNPIAAEQILPGGISGVFGNPGYVSQLSRWLTNSYKPLTIGAGAATTAERSRIEFTP
jgi:penicillin amidase